LFYTAHAPAVTTNCVTGRRGISRRGDLIDKKETGGWGLARLHANFWLLLMARKIFCAVLAYVGSMTDAGRVHLPQSQKEPSHHQYAQIGF